MQTAVSLQTEQLRLLQLGLQLLAPLFCLLDSPLCMQTSCVMLLCKLLGFVLGFKVLLCPLSLCSIPCPQLLLQQDAPFFKLQSQNTLPLIATHKVLCADYEMSCVTALTLNLFFKASCSTLCRRCFSDQLYHLILPGHLRRLCLCMNIAQLLIFPVKSQPCLIALSLHAPQLSSSTSCKLSLFSSITVSSMEFFNLLLTA
mmetsp:Transcript_56916/g.113209  ORF Transcript_56916/g.113209 Transcript_56916/m.113209 type:complete len:201 (-) Transcript_56916:328-930(-)